MESTTIEVAPVAHSLPWKANGNGDWRKNERDGNTLTTGRSLRVLSFRRSIPGKILMPTNQIKELPVRAQAPRELRARALQDLGVYKESQATYPAIQVRVS